MHPSATSHLDASSSALSSSMVAVLSPPNDDDSTTSPTTAKTNTTEIPSVTITVSASWNDDDESHHHVTSSSLSDPSNIMMTGHLYHDMENTNNFIIPTTPIQTQSIDTKHKKNNTMIQDGTDKDQFHSKHEEMNSEVNHPKRKRDDVAMELEEYIANNMYITPTNQNIPAALSPPALRSRQWSEERITPSYLSEFPNLFLPDW
jgi:hypothetical protein